MKEHFKAGETFEETYPTYPFSKLVGASIRVAGWIAHLGHRADVPSVRGAESREMDAVRDSPPRASFDARKPLQRQVATCDLSGWGGPLPRAGDPVNEKKDHRLISIYLWTERRSRP